MNAVPVITCDVCGRATLARISGRGRQPAIEGEAREVQLRAEGWRLSKARDVCPVCAPLVG